MEAYQGQDILKFNDRILTNFADGDVAIITYPNELHIMKIGKNGNAMATHNEQGSVAELKLRVLKGSPDDKFLNSFVLAWKNKSDTFTPASAEFTKIIGVDSGITNEVTTLNFGLPSKIVETKDNVEGDTEQIVSVYTFKFGSSSRALA